jgi:hypothetical protein
MLREYFADREQLFCKSPSICPIQNLASARRRREGSYLSLDRKVTKPERSESMNAEKNNNNT